MPNKNRRSKAVVVKKINHLAQQEQPYPRIVTPPSDPPTISVSKKRKVVIDFTKAPDSEGLWKVVESNVTDYLVANVGEASVTNVFYIIQYIHAWATSGGISVLDSTYGVEAHDAGTPARRPRVGLSYPKNIQTVRRGATSSGATLVTGSTNSTNPVYVHMGIVYWQNTLSPAS